MVYLEVDKTNFEFGKPNLIEKINKYLTHKHNKNFILFYMEGCGPCNATRPEWHKLKNVLSNKFLNRDDIAIISIDHELASKLKNIGNEPSSFPTIKYIADEGKINENYEDSNILKKDRTIDSFVEWIQEKTREKNITKSTNHNTHNKTYKKLNLTSTRKYRGGKWSRKYKRKINCKKPKGFSQKQHCKYGRNKKRN